MADPGRSLTGADLVVDEAIAAPADAEAPSEVAAAATAGDLAYVIFTSGSTGTPRGVPVTQASNSTPARSLASPCTTGTRVGS